MQGRKQSGTRREVGLQKLGKGWGEVRGKGFFF